MFISYSWYNNEMVQIQRENMPKNYNTHASYKSSTQSDEGTYSLVLQTICIFDITVQQYLITCNFPNQIKQFGWIKYWQVITIVFICCELFYRSYSITSTHQYQQCWQCFRTDNHRSNSIAGWCIRHSHQLCPSYGGHCKCWCCW